MIKVSIRTVPLGLAALAASAIAAAAGGDPTGVWLDQAGRGAVEIAPCDKSGGGPLCGRVVWVKSAAHQNRCGEQILGSLKQSGDGTWGDGWIYSPDRGRKFDVELKQVGHDKLRVIGWAGIRMFSETHYWKRATPDLARCGGEQTAAGKAKSDVVASVSQPAAPPSADATSVPVPVPVAVPVPAPVAGRADKPAAKSASRAEDDKPAEKRASRTTKSGELPPQVEKYFKRSADGTCKVDTPWIKVKFDCKRL